MKVFVAASRGETEADTINNSIGMIRKAKELYGDDIEVKTPFDSGYFPAGVDHILYSLGKSVEIMSQCEQAIFPEWYSCDWLLTELKGIWRRRK